jgi:tRNA pseudouridine55 synthase
LANDLGAALGCGGYLSSLRRTRIGEFKVEDAMGIEAAEAWIEKMFEEGGVKPDAETQNG